MIVWTRMKKILLIEDGGYRYEAEEGEEGDEGYGKDWTILSGRKYCPQGCTRMKCQKIDRVPTCASSLTSFNL